MVECVLGLEVAACGVEAAELDGNAGADTEERGEGALVEGEGAFVAVDVGCGGEGGGWSGGGLEADFYYVKGLAWRRLAGDFRCAWWC